MLSEDQRDRLDVVLVSPRNPLNIGAVARAMANFGFSRMTVVAPYEAHWREARSAVGAPQVLQDAKCTQYLPEALADCTLVVGTGSLTYRKPEQPVVRLPDLPQLVGEEMARGGRVALVFGPEKHGLTREDLSHCHMLAEIPTDPRQPSMNLGQAAAVCLYELAMRASRPDAPGKGAAPSAVPSSRLEILAGVIEQVMAAAEYSPAAMRQANQHDLRVLLRRLALSEADTRRVLGIFRRILWRLKRTQSAKESRQ